MGALFVDILADNKVKGDPVMEETIDLQELFKILKKRLLLIVTLAILVAVASGAFTVFLVTPIYQASTELVVSRADIENPVNQSEMAGNVQLMNSFNQIIATPRILDLVVQELGLEGETGRSLGNRIDARNATNSLVMVLTVRHENPEDARNIANMTAIVFAQELPEIMNFDNISILAPADLPTSPISPRLTMNVALGLVVGAMSGIFLAFLLEFLDKTVKTEDEVVNLIGLPVLGVIQTVTERDVRRMKELLDQDKKVIQVTGSERRSDA